MGIMDMFRSTPAAPAKSETPAAPLDNKTVPTGATPKSDGTPAAIPAVPAATDPKSPLAGYEKLWETDPNAKQGQDSPVPSFNADPKKLMEVAGKIDFAKVIPQDVAEAALKGDTAAFAKAMNAVAQAGYAQSAHATTKIVEAALQQHTTKLLNEILPAEVRRQSISNTVAADNPLFTNPAVAPMLSMVEAQFSTKYPTASPAEISKHAKQFVAEFGAAIAAGSPAVVPANKQKANEPDWEAFFNVK